MRKLAKGLPFVMLANVCFGCAESVDWDVWLESGIWLQQDINWFFFPDATLEWTDEQSCSGARWYTRKKTMLNKEL